MPNDQLPKRDHRERRHYTLKCAAAHGPRYVTGLDTTQDADGLSLSGAQISTHRLYFRRRDTGPR